MRASQGALETITLSVVTWACADQISSREQNALVAEYPGFGTPALRPRELSLYRGGPTLTAAHPRLKKKAAGSRAGEPADL